MAGYTDIPPSYFDTLIARPGEMLADTAVGVIEGGRKLRDMYNTTEDYLDEGLARVGDLFDRSPPRMAGGPMSRSGYRHHSGVPVPLDEYPSSHANPHLLFSDFPTQQAYDDAVAEAHLLRKEYNIMQDGMNYPVEDYNNREYNIMRHGVDYPVDNRSDWQKWKDSVSGGY
jgi:hypothetical protein